MAYPILKLKLAVFILICLPAILAAQNAATLPDVHYKTFPTVFYTTFSDNLPIYNGRVFTGYPPNVIGNAFFKDNDKIWYKGFIIYDSIAYENMDFKYDVFTDELIVKGKQNVAYLLPTSKVSAFSFDEHYFVYFNKELDKNIPQGFYQIIDTGRLTLIARRQKSVSDNMEEQRVRPNFILADKFFIAVNGKYHLISTKKNLFKIIKDKKRQIKKQLRSQKTSFRNNREDYITTAIRSYNNL